MRESVTNMTDRGMRALAAMAAHHPSLEVLDARGTACTVCLKDAWNVGMRVIDSRCVAVRLAAGNKDVTDSGWAALSTGVRRNSALALKQLYGVDLAKFDDTLPDHVVKDNNSWDGNKALLSYYRDRAAHGTTTVCKFRVMLVGESGVGKTTLSRKLANTELPVPTTSTHGVETS